MVKRRQCMADGGIVDWILRVASRTLPKPQGEKHEPGVQSRTKDDPTRSLRAEGLNPRTVTPENSPVQASGLQEEALRRRKQMHEAMGYQNGGGPFFAGDREIKAPSVGPGSIASFLANVPGADSAMPSSRLGPNLAQSASPVGMSPQSQGLLTGNKDYGVTPAQLANSGKPAFVWEDGTQRTTGAAAPPAYPRQTNRVMEDLDKQIAMNTAMSGLTMAEHQALQNPGSQPYGPYGRPIRSGMPVITPGSAAEASMLNRQSDALKSLRDNLAAQQSRYAEGGIVRFAGKGGPRDDKIPVAVAGNEINVSDGEAAVILPAKTVANKAALGIIGSIIEATNDGRKPKMGMHDGGRYAQGELPDEEALRRSRGLIGGPPFARAASMAAQSRALNAPTNVVPPISQPNWTAGGNPQNVGPIGGGQWTNQGWNSPPGRATMPQGGGIQSVLQALPAPAPELMKASSDARTAAGARAAGRASKEAAAYANRPAFETSPLVNVRQNAALARKLLGRGIPAVGGAISAANIADVATDPNKTKADVATQAAREAGGLGAAVAGGALGAKAGAALGVLGGPLTPITVPAGALAGGIVGGLASNYGANALMDLGGYAPSKDSNGVVTQFFGGSAHQPTVDPVRAKHNAILNSGEAAGSIKLPITQAAKQTALANTDAARRVAANEDSGSTMHNGIVTSEMGRGFDPTKLTFEPGYGMATNATGKTVYVTPSQYTAADGSPTSRWEDTQAYKDAIARNEADKLRLAQMQAQRLGADPMAVQAASQGIASALLANKAQEATMQRNDQLQSLLAKAAATKDPVQHKIALQNYLAARGINPRDPDEWEIKSGGQYTVPNGMGGIQVVERGPVAFHKPTQKWLTPDGSLSQGSQATQYTVTVGMPVQAEDGEHTFQGKTVIVKNGKVAEVK